MRKGRDLLGQNLSIAAHVRGAHLEKVVEIPRDQMRLLDFRDLDHRLVERGQRGLAGLGHLHFDKGDVIQPEPDGIKQRTVALDGAHLLEPPQPGLCRGFRQADPPRQFGDRHPPIACHFLQDRAVESVQFRNIQFACLPCQNQFV